MTAPTYGSPDDLFNCPMEGCRAPLHRMDYGIPLKQRWYCKACKRYSWEPPEETWEYFDALWKEYTAA